MTRVLKHTLQQSKLYLLKWIPAFPSSPEGFDATGGWNDKALTGRENMSKALEHFNIFRSALWPREDKADKEDCAAILKYRE